MIRQTVFKLFECYTSSVIYHTLRFKFSKLNFTFLFISDFMIQQSTACELRAEFTMKKGRKVCAYVCMTFDKGLICDGLRSNNRRRRFMTLVRIFDCLMRVDVRISSPALAYWWYVSNLFLPTNCGISTFFLFTSNILLKDRPVNSVCTELFVQYLVLENRKSLWLVHF